MICDEDQSRCAFNEIAVLAGISNRVRSCSVSSAETCQFAAVNAFVSSMDLPYIDEHGMMSAPCRDFKACRDGSISLISTLISLVSSYKQVRNVIVFDDNMTGAEQVVTSVDAVRSQGNAGITCVVSSVSGSSRYITTASATNGRRSVSRSQLTEILRMLTETDYSLTWAASPASMELAMAVQLKPTNMWVNNTATAMETVSLTGSHGTRNLPMMYALPSPHTVVSVNFGSPRPNVAPRAQDMLMRLNTVTSQFLNAQTKSRKCYYCSYMQAVHDSVCVNDNAGESHEFSFSDIVNNIVST